jgi:hypothetical protein
MKPWLGTRNTALTDAKADLPPVWAAAGIAAGGLALVSPWLAGVAAAAVLGTAVWRARRPVPVPSLPKAGDLATPWSESDMDGVRLDLLTLWERINAGCMGLNTSVGRLGARMEDWGRLLGSGAANVDTLARVTMAVRGDIDSAVRTLTQEIPHLAGWHTAWENARQQLLGAAALHRAQHANLRAWEAAWDAAALQRVALTAAVRNVRLPDVTDVSGLLADVKQQVAAMAAIADDAGRLGKVGWAVALAATKAQDAMATWSQRAEAVLAPWDGASRSIDRLLATIEALPMLAVPGAAAELATGSDLGAWRLPDIGPLIERLDRASHESELSVGLSENVASQLQTLQDNTERLASALADARHRTSELLILSGYVRTRASAPACHLNRTAWCITDGNCERCPLTQLDEADFPELLGANAVRPQPAVQRTGWTIDLRP